MHRDTNRPFFLNLWYYAVHTPIQGKDDLVRKYRRKAAELGLDTQQAMVEGHRFPAEHKKDERIVRRIIQSDPEYAAMIETLDTNIGLLMNALETLGLGNDILVLFTSDNGGLATDGSSVDSDGESFLAVLTGEDARPGGPACWHYPHYGNQGGSPGASIRLGDWKFILFFEDDHEELYNPKTDLGENSNLAATEPEKRRELSELLTRWSEQTHPRTPAANPGFVSRAESEPCGHDPASPAN